MVSEKLEECTPQKPFYEKGCKDMISLSCLQLYSLGCRYTEKDLHIKSYWES